MNKLCAVFIFVMCMPFASVCMAAGLGADCASADMVDRQSKDVSCHDLKIAHGQECFAYCDDGALKRGVRKCDNGTFELDPVSGVDGLFKRCGSLKEACEASGHRFDDAYNTCVCDGNSQEWNKTSRQCQDTEEYTRCNDASDAQWDWHGGYCKCKDANKLWDNGACRPSKGMTECKDIIAKLPADYNGSVAWNPAANQCQCVVGKIAADGEKIVNPDDYYIGYLYDYNFVDKNGNQQTKRIDATVCYLKQAPRHKKDVDSVANSDALRQTRDDIKKAHDKLKPISQAWDKSRWKTASGNFNGARLASDSIAGVVLGTVGGVITSNVIKKNQVRGGFEDINCTIGGQRVADYDDQFSVGIQ